MTDTDRRRTETKDRVATLTAQGRTPREIALLLGISIQMVYRHLKKLEMQPAQRAS